MASSLRLIPIWASKTLMKGERKMGAIPDQWRFMEGDEVVTSDGESVGFVKGFLPEDPGTGKPKYLVVEQGFFTPDDSYVPVSAVADVSDATVTLNVAKDADVVQSWRNLPLDDPANSQG
jgi:hypothetical protein